MSDKKEFFKNIIDKCLSNNDFTLFYILCAELVSADNNINEGCIKENCKLIDVLIDVLSEYKNFSNLQNMRNKLIEYNKGVKNARYNNV
jgi:hypothetical protein